MTQKNMTDRREWARKLMDKKGVALNDEEWWRGKAQTVVHINSIKENLLYEYILRCSPPPSSIPTIFTNTTTEAQRYLPQRDTDVLDSGTTHLYIASTAPHGPPDTSTQKIV